MGSKSSTSIPAKRGILSAGLLRQTATFDPDTRVAGAKCVVRQTIPKGISWPASRHIADLAVALTACIAKSTSP